MVCQGAAAQQSEVILFAVRIVGVGVGLIRIAPEVVTLSAGMKTTLCLLTSP